MNSSLNKILGTAPFMCAVTLSALLFLFVVRADGQALQIMPEWKAHFTNTPVIEDCVYQYEATSGQPKTKLMQFRCQSNAFFLREIRDLNDDNSNVIPIMDFYAGRFESNCWAISWTADTHGVLRLFPNSDNIWRYAPTNTNKYLVYMADRALVNVLYYGIGNLDPESIKWTSGATFTAVDVGGQKVNGRVTEVFQGKPTQLEWRYDGAPGNDFTFILNYKYDKQFDLSYFPSEIQLFSNFDGKKVLQLVWKIIVMNISEQTLDRHVYEPDRYFSVPSSISNRVSVLLNSNGATYEVSHGLPVKVFPASARGISNPSPLAKKHPQLVRFLFISFALLSAFGVFFAWRRARTKTK